MTEKQIEQLKKLLAETKLPENSVELDDLILKAAHDNAQATQDKSKRKPSSISVLGLRPISFLRSATLAVVITLGVFVVMGQMVSVNDDVVVFNEPEILVDRVAHDDALSESKQAAITFPESITLEPAPTRLSRDQILMRFELVDTEDLLAKGAFELGDNSGFVKNKVVLAMVDIDVLIQLGELEDARQRYSNLKTECDGCRLPSTLEALVLAAQKFAIENVPSKTG